MWLPAVGAILFLTVGLIWGLSGPSASEETPAPAPSASASAAPSATAPAQPKTR